MSTSVYKINKGINKPIEFKGLKAQYIWYLGIGLVVLLIVFAILYIAGVHVFISLILIVMLGALLFAIVYHLSSKYGQYGIMKLLASQGIPKVVKNDSRVTFLSLKKR